MMLKFAGVGLEFIKVQGVILAGGYRHKHGSDQGVLHRNADAKLGMRMKKGLFYLSMNLSLPFSCLGSVFAEEVGGFGNLTALHFIFFRRHFVIGESRIAGQSSMSVR